MCWYPNLNIDSNWVFIPRRGRTLTFVVLDGPTLGATIFFAPCFVLYEIINTIIIATINNSIAAIVEEHSRSPGMV